MDLELNEEQSELRAIAKQLLDRRGDLALARESLEGRGDASELYDEMMQLGWPTVGLEVDDPFGLAGLCVLLEQVGAHAAPAPLVDGAVVARLARDANIGSSAGAARGELPASLCVVEEGSGWDLSAVGAAAVAGPTGGYRVTAEKLDVHHGRIAGVFAVIATVAGEPAALLIPSAAEGCRVASGGSLDPSVGAATVRLDDVEVPAEACVRGRALLDAIAVGTVATAAEGVGAASRALTMAVEYATERRQFGRPIGSFQALQHLLADMYVKRETAWSTVLYAAGALEEGLDDADDAVSIAKAYASRAAREVVEGALQVLGGIGFTWEHDLHLLQRRVLECERRFGDAIDHERRLTESAAERRTLEAGQLA